MRTFSRDCHFFGKPEGYILIDVDCLDLAFAPGVSHIEPWGLSFRDVLNILHSLQGDIVAADVVEFNPHGMTGMVAAKLLREQDEGFEGKSNASERFLLTLDVDDDDDFGALACLPLYDLESETTTFDPSNLFDDVKLDDRNLAILQKPKKPPCYGNFGKGKDLETLRLMLSAPPPPSCQQNPTGPTKSDAHHQRQDWDDEEKLENSKRKLHQGYQEFQNKRKKIQVLDIKNLPLPSKSPRGQVLSQNKPLISSRKCQSLLIFRRANQTLRGSQNPLIMMFTIGQDWDDEKKLETSVQKLHQAI
ncbi:hypothetical protein L3X38_038468 [Prunus dulcis]|uniref:Uncharacterized protein n=1 Tax=Prunus dulcis TaxID=3755 RepID=A0AAD4YRJ4_PRUDU|nr:hypothetical protein L3X38_038468 [Prunus dulcis]